MTEGDVDHLTKGIELIEEMNRHVVEVGGFKQVGDRSVEYMQMIIGVNETGAEIHPKSSKYLTIPMPVAGKHRAREIDGLFFYMTKSGKPSLAKDVDGQLVVYFLLVNEVRIPARPFLRETVNRVLDHVVSMVAHGVSDILGGRTRSWRPTMDAIGKYVAREVKKTIARMQSPANAPITVANKGFNNPLVDTGAMQRSIDWRVV